MNSARYVLGVILLSACATLCFPQADSLRIPFDTAHVFPLLRADSLQLPPAKPASGKYEPAKKPWVAIGLSAALPGLGQIYDQSYWKLPIIWGLGGYWIYEWNQMNTKYQDFRQKYSASVTRLTPAGNDNYLLNRDFYRNERDSFAWYLGALYFLNLVDAYVGANLYDFDVSPELGEGGRIVPKVTATIRLKL